MTSEIERVSAFAATLIGNACERHSAEIAVMGFHEFQQVQPKSCHWCCEADRDRLAAEVDRLLQALRNIRLAAARGRTFGHQATLQPHVRMAARKDEALEQVLQFCAQLGVEGSLLRKANAALAEAPTPDPVLIAQARVLENPPTCPTCRHYTLDDKGDHWCALGISTAGRVPGLVTHLQPFGCSLHETSDDETSDDDDSD